MYANYWGLSESPFGNLLAPRWFVQTAGHEEALARLLFLIEQRRRCGALFGSAGTGKSLVLRMLSAEVARDPGETVLLDLLGRNSRELLWETLAGLGLAPDSDSPRQLWRKLQDHLDANRYSHVPTVLLFDHLERAEGDCLAAIERLFHLSAEGHSGLTLILAIRETQSPRLTGLLREISDLRIELPPLERDDALQYIETLLSKAGARRGIFEPAALVRLFEETQGVPRELNKLADLSLLAGMADSAERIDETMVAAAAEELHLLQFSSHLPPRMSRARFPAEI